MASTDDFGARLESIERQLAELDQAVKRTPTQPASDPLVRISPTGWLKVTGPVFAVMALGSGLLWNGQRTLGTSLLAMQDSLHVAMRETQESTHAQLIELTRTTARLEATTERLDGAIDDLSISVKELRDEVKRLSERADRLEG
jgi:uncharacterized protein HemX